MRENCGLGSGMESETETYGGKFRIYITYRMDVSISDPLLPSHKNPAWQILKVMEFSPIHLVCFRIKSKTQVFEFKVWEGVCVCVCVCVWAYAPMHSYQML